MHLGPDYGEINSLHVVTHSEFVFKFSGAGIHIFVPWTKRMVQNQ